MWLKSFSLHSPGSEPGIARFTLSILSTRRVPKSRDRAADYEVVSCAIEASCILRYGIDRTRTWCKAFEGSTLSLPVTALRSRKTDQRSRKTEQRRLVTTETKQPVKQRDHACELCEQHETKIAGLEATILRLETAQRNQAQLPTATAKQVINAGEGNGGKPDNSDSSSSDENEDWTDKRPRDVCQPQHHRRRPDREKSTATQWTTDTQGNHVPKPLLPKLSDRTVENVKKSSGFGFVSIPLSGAAAMIELYDNEYKFKSMKGKV